MKHQTTYLALLLTMPIMTGCPKRAPIDGSMQPASPMPLIIASMESGAELAYLGANLARDKQDLVGCIASHTIAAALITASEGVRGNISGGALPSIDYDISDCLSILLSGEGDPPQGTEVPATVQPLVETALIGASMLIQSYSAQMACEELAWATAGIAYARGATPAIISEIEAPDGSITIAGVHVDLESCEED